MWFFLQSMTWIAEVSKPPQIDHLLIQTAWQICTGRPKVSQGQDSETSEFPSVFWPWLWYNKINDMLFIARMRKPNVLSRNSSCSGPTQLTIPHTNTLTTTHILCIAHTHTLYLKFSRYQQTGVVLMLL